MTVSWCVPGVLVGSRESFATVPSHEARPGPLLLSWQPKCARTTAPNAYLRPLTGALIRTDGGGACATVKQSVDEPSADAL